MMAKNTSLTVWCRAALVHSIIVCLLFTGTCVADEPPFSDPMVGWRHYEDPALAQPEQELYWPPELQQAWLAALRTDESDLRREVADTISLALQLGMDPIEPYESVLLEIACNGSELTATRLSAVNTLVACEFREVAESLAGVLDDCPLSLRVLIERGLAEWNFKPMRAVWLARLEDDEVDFELFRIAAEALAVVGEERAVPAFRKIVESEFEGAAKKLFAAATWSQVARVSGRSAEDQITTSRMLLSRADESRSIEKLVALRLLAGQDSAEAKQIQVSFANDPWNVVRAEALKHLLDVDPRKVVGLAESHVSDSDANVRRFTIDALGTDANARNTRLLARCLGDLVPENRMAARDHLLRFAEQHSLAEEVAGEVTEVLRLESWQGLEQALLVLTKLQHRANRERVFELLNHPRPEVFVTAAWAVKHLAEDSWSDDVLASLETLLEMIEAGVASYQSSYAAAHLVEAMGMLEHREAMRVIVKMIPKASPYDFRVRCAAIWSAGRLIDAEEDPELVSQIEGRLLDNTSFPPEEPEVRAISAVALGQMRSLRSLDILREQARYESMDSVVGVRAYWAVSHLTGEPMPETAPQRQVLGGWVITGAADVIE